MVAGGVSIAAKGMADQDGVVARFVELPIGLVCDVDRTEVLAAFQQQRRVRLNDADDLGFDQTHRIDIHSTHKAH